MSCETHFFTPTVVYKKKSSYRRIPVTIAISKSLYRLKNYISLFIIELKNNLAFSISHSTSLQSAPSVPCMFQWTNQLIYFPAWFWYDHKHVSSIPITKSKFLTFLILQEGGFTSLEKYLFFLKCKYYLSGKILPGIFCLKCECFRKLQTSILLRI